MNDLPARIDPAVEMVITQVLDGVQLRHAVKAAGLSPQLFHYRLSKDKAAAVAYSRAVEIRADLLADEALHLADGDGDPHKVRNQISIRQWLASKLYAQRYGDRIDLNVTQTIDVSATLAEARARILRPARDQHDVIDARVLDSQARIAHEPSDAQSLSVPTAPPNVEPDIFS